MDVVISKQMIKNKAPKHMYFKKKPSCILTKNYIEKKDAVNHFQRRKGLKMAGIIDYPCI